MRIVQTDRAPLPAGHYSQAVVHSGLVYVSGQLPINPATGTGAGETIEAQMEQALANVADILQAAGSSMDRLLRVTIYIADMGLWGRANAVYARVLGDHRPARAVAPILPLPMGYLVEIEAVAALQGADS